MFLTIHTVSKTVSAFSIRSGGSTSFLGKSLPRGCSAASSSTTTTTTMFFSNFLGGGGAYAQQIPYDTLDHPVPELAQLAAQQQTTNNDLPPTSTSPRNPQYSMATFAGGCFWGLELAYQRIPGVVYTAVGYTQGSEAFPTYSEVSSGNTGHTEAVMVYYDPAIICSYETTLLDTFFSRVDITTRNGQGMDRGKQYRTGIYFHTSEQEEAVRKRMEQEASRYKKRPVATEIKQATAFWPAEKYHQQYLEKGGRLGMPQDASKGATDEIRCYG